MADDVRHFKLLFDYLGHFDMHAVMLRYIYLHNILFDLSDPHVVLYRLNESLDAVGVEVERVEAVLLNQVVDHLQMLRDLDGLG